jgi:hypothetical protein
MPNYLHNLQVSKVSFVGKPANKREFLLLKSTEGDSNKQTNNQKSVYGGTKPMRDVVKQKLTDLMKSGHDPDKVIDVLKSDDVVKLQDDEVQEVQNFLDITSSVSTQKKQDSETTELQKRAETAEKEKEDLLKRVSALENTQHRDSVREWVKKNCAFVPHATESIVENIIKLERVDATSAEEFKESLQKSSAAIAQSRALSEAGTTRDALSKDIGTTDLVSKVMKQISEVRKSEGKPATAAAIEGVIKSHGNAYIEYMEAHRQRARTGGMLA